jgi:hypothetical protein
MNKVLKCNYIPLTMLYNVINHEWIIFTYLFDIQYIMPCPYYNK